MSTVQSTEDISGEAAHDTQAKSVRRGGARRRRLNLDEEREIARLYAETTASTSVIRAQFGIGESSLYRIVQRQGIPLRGRTASAKASAPERTKPATTRRARTSSAGGRRTTPAAVAAVPQTAAGSAVRFRIRYIGERVFEARDIQGALRQAESLGATDITSMVREG